MEMSREGRMEKKGELGRKLGKKRWGKEGWRNEGGKGEGDGREQRKWESQGRPTDICLAFAICQAVSFHTNYFIDSSQRLCKLDIF